MSYPQLFPANLSLPYVFLKTTDLWMFGRGLMPLFPLATLLLFADLAVRTRNYGYVLAIPLTASLIDTVLGPIRFVGYADGPLMFLIAAALYVIASRTEESAAPADGVTRDRASALLAAAALLTKASGLFACLALGLLRSIWQRQTVSASDATRSALRWLAIALLLPLPWFFFAETRLMPSIDRQINAREVLTFSHRDRSPGERLWFGVANLARSGGVAGVFVIGLAATGFTTRRWRPVAGLGFVWGAMWVFGLSYDTRNLSPAIPFLGLAAGMGVAESAIRMTRTRFLIALGAAILGVSAVYPADVLRTSQAGQLQSVGIPSVNASLADYFGTNAPDGRILSNYNFLPYNEGLGKAYAHEYFHDMSTFRRNLADTKPRYILYSVEWCDPAIHEWLEKETKEGRISLASPIGFWRLLRIESP
jgi:hypothetical protein